MACSPRRRIRLATVAGEWMVHAPGWAIADLRRLDTSNGCQDHTLLPSATMPLVSPARESLTGFHPPCDPFACTTSSRPPHPTPTFVTIASRPSSQGWDAERGATDF